YLLAGYIAYEVQQAMTGQGFSLSSSDVNTWEWIVPLVVAAPCIVVIGLLCQQAFLRWNQGQELRQALITIAISVIVADQIIAHFPRSVGTNTQKFGGNAVSLTWPGWTDRFVNLHIAGVQYSLARFVVLVLVIVGGMGSIFGAAAGSILYALVLTFSAAYLPTTGSDCCTQYSIVITFALIAVVLAFRPRGLFGRHG